MGAGPPGSTAARSKRSRREDRRRHHADETDQPDGDGTSASKGVHGKRDDEDPLAGDREGPAGEEPAQAALANDPTQGDNGPTKAFAEHRHVGASMARKPS